MCNALQGTRMMNNIGHDYVLTAPFHSQSERDCDYNMCIKCMLHTYISLCASVFVCLLICVCASNRKRARDACSYYKIEKTLLLSSSSIWLYKREKKREKEG